jgi:AraC-like DNA-binding protein
MSPKRRQRRVSDEATDLRSLIEQAHRIAALDYLTETTRTVTDSAGRMGFSESSSFGRVARQWFGLSRTEICQG